jgi:hypothetical protein
MIPKTLWLMVSEKKGRPLGLLVLSVSCLGLVVWLLSGNHLLPLRQSSGVMHELAVFDKSTIEPVTLPASGAVGRQVCGVLALLQAAQADEFERLMQNMTDQDVIHLLSEMNSADLKGESARYLFDRWATARPQDAAGWAQGLADPQARQSFMELAAIRWANQDLTQAAAWARNLPEEDSRMKIMESVGSEAIRSAPVEALRLGVELPAGEKRTNLLRRAAAEWAVSDRERALEWARQIKDSDLRQQVTGQVVAASANHNPAQAAVIALEEMTPGAEQDRALVSIVEHWLQTDPEGASQWVSGFPDNELGQDAVSSLVNGWANRDLEATAEWLSSLPAGALRTNGILAYADVLKRTDPELAKRWKTSLSVPDILAVPLEHP